MFFGKVCTATKLIFSWMDRSRGGYKGKQQWATVLRLGRPTAILQDMALLLYFTKLFD